MPAEVAMGEDHLRAPTPRHEEQRDLGGAHRVGLRRAVQAEGLAGKAATGKRQCAQRQTDQRCRKPSAASVVAELKSADHVHCRFSYIQIELLFRSGSARPAPYLSLAVLFVSPSVP